MLGDLSHSAPQEKSADSEEAKGDRNDSDDESSSEGSSSSSSTDTEAEDRMADLMKEASASPSSSEDEGRNVSNGENAVSSRSPAPPRSRPRRNFKAYDAPISTISVLMLGCWTLRIPVTYMDFVRFAYSSPARGFASTDFP